MSAPMYMMTLLSMLQARPLKFVKQFRISRIAERPVSVAKKITVLSSAKDSTLSVSRLDSKEKGSFSLAGKRRAFLAMLATPGRNSKFTAGTSMGIGTGTDTGAGTGTGYGSCTGSGRKLPASAGALRGIRW